jgi:oligopeptide/dipeptide ABC transporter ATP-binding protein
VQAQILNLMRELQRELGLTYLFISHDLAVVNYISDWIGVMYLGRLVELAPAGDIFARPQHPYTRLLLDTVPDIGMSNRDIDRPAGEVPNPITPPTGCHFHPRCPLANARCRTEPPAFDGRARHRALPRRGRRPHDAPTRCERPDDAVRFHPTARAGPLPFAHQLHRAAPHRAGHHAGGPGPYNAAPMSFFNVFSHEPPIVIIWAFSARPDGSEKDTLVNIRRTGQFCVNMVDMALADAMILCGVNFASDVDETAWAGLETSPCRQIDARYVTATPCAMECRLDRIIDYPRRAIVMGEVLEMTVRDDCLDAQGRYVDPAVYHPIARLHADNYIVADRSSN